MRRTRCTIVVAAAACLVFGGCGGGGSAEPSTVAPTSAPPPSVLPTTATSAPPASTATVADTVAATVPLPAGVVGLSPDGPWRLVDSAPGITTPGLVYELMPKLWVYLPVEEDLSAGITWTFTEQDREIIEAYLQAQLVYYRAVTSSPIDLELPDWGVRFTNAEEAYFADLRSRREQGQLADLDVGVVLRPQVIGDERSDTAGVVIDCILDGGVFRMPDGTLAPGSTPGVVEYGEGMRIELVDGRWIVTQVGGQPDACSS